MDFTVYILYSERHKKIYIGFTSNLIQRFYSHNQLSVKGYSVKFRPWVVVYTEIFSNKTDAMKREKQLKSANARQWIWGKIKTEFEMNGSISMN